MLSVSSAATSGGKDGECYRKNNKPMRLHSESLQSRDEAPAAEDAFFLLTI